MRYPEREAAPLAGPDRLLAAAGFRVHSLFGRRLANAAAAAAQVRELGARWRGGSLPELLPQLRYRMRRTGLTRQAALECFGLYCAAMPPGEAQALSADAVAAASWLAQGGVAELAAPGPRGQALALAGFARMVHGTSVHLLTASERAAQGVAGSMQDVLGALGLELGLVSHGMDAVARRKAYACHVVCAAYREVALDYLRDRAQSAGRPGTLRGRLERFSEGASGGEALVLNGLHCALVLDADLVMLDDARAPLTIAREADRSQERLMYEQAMELARALKPGTDFQVDDDGLQLTDAAAALLGRLVTPLGGLWAARERREELVRLALEALYVLERDADYRVEQGRVVLPERPREEAEAAAARDAVLQILLEVKEGCRTSSRREVVARISVPAFLSRYLHLGGVCADARGVEREFWALYGLKTALAGARAAQPQLRARVFAAAADKHAALLAAVRSESAAGHAVLIAVRSPGEAQAVERALAEAGIGAGTVRGRGDELDRRALASLERPGGVAVSLYPAEAGLPAPAPQRPSLTLLVSELHDARRHAAGIFAAYGASRGELLLALEDERTKSALDETVVRWARRLAGAGGELPARASAWVAGLAQRGAERAQALLRLEVLSRDQHLSDLLAFSGPGH